MFSMNLMYKYVDFYREIYFEYVKKIIFVLLNTCHEFSLLNETFSIIFCEKPNWFQYYFVTIIYLCFIIINATVAQIVFYECSNNRNYEDTSIMRAI